MFSRFCVPCFNPQVRGQSEVRGQPDTHRPARGLLRQLERLRPAVHRPRGAAARPPRHGRAARRRWQVPLQRLPQQRGGASRLLGQEAGVGAVGEGGLRGGQPQGGEGRRGNGDVVVARLLALNSLPFNSLMV